MTVTFKVTVIFECPYVPSVLLNACALKINPAKNHQPRQLINVA